MCTMTEYVRKYVKQNQAITLEEVKKKLVNETNVEGTYASIKTTLYLVRKEFDIEPTLIQVTKIIQNYVEEHENFVSFEEVRNYILNERRIEITESSIRTILKSVLKESKGKLKRSGLKQILRDYLTEKEGPVTFAEVKDYVLNKRGMNVPDHTLRNTLYFVRKEFGIKIKSTTITEMVRDYCKESKEKVVTFDEVKNYILYETQTKASDSSIKTALRTVQIERGVLVKKINISEIIRNYIKEREGQVTISEMKDYVLNQMNIKTVPSTIECAYYRARKEYIANS